MGMGRFLKPRPSPSAERDDRTQLTLTSTGRSLKKPKLIKHSTINVQHSIVYTTPISFAGLKLERWRHSITGDRGCSLLKEKREGRERELTEEDPNPNIYRRLGTSTLV
jgi:hypothetical protein